MGTVRLKCPGTESKTWKVSIDARSSFWLRERGKELNASRGTAGRGSLKKFGKIMARKRERIKNSTRKPRRPKESGDISYNGRDLFPKKETVTSEA